MFESAFITRIGKLCKAEGVVDFFLACVGNSSESGLTPSKRSRVVESDITIFNHFQWVLNNRLHFYM